MVHFHSTAGAPTNTIRPSQLGTTQQPPSSSTFQQQLSDAGFSAFQNLFGGSSASTASTTTSASVHPTSGLPGAATSAAGAAPSSVTTPVATTQPKTSSTVPVTQTDPVTMLQNAMIAQGLDPSQVQMAFQTQNVLYPGGSYTLNQVKCQFGNGRVLFIDADAMKVNPEIAAMDIKWVEQHPTFA